MIRTLRTALLTCLAAGFGFAALAPLTAQADVPHRHKVCHFDAHHHRVCHWAR